MGRWDGPRGGGGGATRSAGHGGQQQSGQRTRRPETGRHIQRRVWAGRSCCRRRPGRLFGGRETPARAMAQREHHGTWVMFHHGEKRSMIHVSLLLLDDVILVMYSQVQNSSGDPSDLGVATSGARAASGPSWSGPCLRVCTGRQLHSAAASHLKRYSCAVYATADSHNERRSFGTGPLPACPRCSLPRSRFPLQVVGKAGSVVRFGPVSRLRGGRLGGPAPTVVAHDAPQSAAAL